MESHGFRGFSWIKFYLAEFCQNPKLERIICSTMPQYDLVIVQFDNSFVFLWPILCTAYFCWTGSRQMGGVSRTNRGGGWGLCGAVLMPGPHLGNCQLGGNNANAYACQRADTITIGRICKQGETLPFIIWPLVGIQGRLRFSKSNVLLLSPAFCNFSNDTLTRTIKSVEIWRSRRFRWNPFKSCGTERSAENNNWASFVSSFLWCRAVENKS